MDHQGLIWALALAFLVVGLSVAAQRLALASPILLLVAGAVLAFVPVLPPLEVDPEFVLLTLLPPLLYSSGVNMSWRGFRSYLRPILLLAIGCVLFTAAAVAVVAHYILGLSWPVGFVLGAIVSPPDAVAPMAMMRRMRLPRRLITVLEGESLVNDATALVALSFALGAEATGTFSPAAAATKFACVIAGEIAFGMLAGWAALWLRHLANDPRAELLLSLTTPFVAFWPPHALGGSGVVACVAAGLWVSWNGRQLIRPATRLQGYFFWDLVTWAVEALVFLLTGLQARAVAESLFSDGWTRALAAGALVSVTVILVRFAWVFPATYLPRTIPAVRWADSFPNWRMPFLVSFAGLRGVVSLAAALSIPLTIDGRPFPDRDLVLFTTFCVIAVTLVGLGTTLPRMVRALGLPRAGADEAAGHKRDERAVRLDGIDAVLAAIDEVAANGASPTAVNALRRRHADRRRHLATTADERTPEDPVADESALQLRLVDVERAAITRAYDENRLTDEARRRIEREFDLEEARVRYAGASAGANGGDLAE
ncbi:putative Na(+)/H(+) exchanger [Methylobacterium crusticola]|uniref:Na(+)/H(+) exchanger n=1 Tax=Methylobacterium crusticola TaxID=1697972 RepID=A0ABQ4QUP2_9HYPH|nr:Na+/H+ antiporter [Methylobacterium crusticola]GJD49062.1 putative Na(+)/H(+) exchanger [Methylobacterium crusticola]